MASPEKAKALLQALNESGVRSGSYINDFLLSKNRSTECCGIWLHVLANMVGQDYATNEDLIQAIKGQA